MEIFMDIIDQYDLEFINEHCPEGQVPVFFVKGKIKNVGLHKKIKEIYHHVSLKMGHRIPCLPAIDEIVVEKAKKDNFVWAYYATPEERELLRAEKHRLMNLNFRERFSIHTSCFSFNDNGESSDAFRMPLGKLTTTKDIKESIEHIKNTFLTNDAYISAIPDGKNNYTLCFSAFQNIGKNSINILSLTTAHARLQLELMKEFEDCKLALCDTNGNYYDSKKAKKMIAEKASTQNCSYPLTKSQNIYDSRNL